MTAELSGVARKPNLQGRSGRRAPAIGLHFYFCATICSLLMMPADSKRCRRFSYDKGAREVSLDCFFGRLDYSSDGLLRRATIVQPESIRSPGLPFPNLATGKRLGGQIS